MKKMFLILLTGLILLSCKETVSGSISDPSSGSESGTVTVNLSGVPFSTDNLTIINLRVSEIWIDIGVEEENWITLFSFDPGLDINLLNYLGENKVILAEEVVLPIGMVNQIRIILDAPEEGEDPAESASYLFYDDGAGNTRTEALIIPSGSSSGLKGVGVFTIPRNGGVNIVISFDARRFVSFSDDSVKMKPVLWVIAENEAATITGTVSAEGGLASYPDLSVFAYEDGSYDSGEIAPDADGIQFPGAVYNGFVDPDDGSYILPYLAEGIYDLVLAYKEGDNFVELQVETGIELLSGETKVYIIEISPPAL